MFFRSFTDEKLAQYSYLVGCQKTGEAIVIDPPRQVEHIVDVAKEEGLTIIAAADTHIHADYVSGARQLGVQYGAKLYLSDEGDDNWKYEFPEGVDIELVTDGSKFSIGNVDFEVMYTPGHTPESISFILTDRGGGADKPLGIFTGDFVFVGDIGRPDLLEEAAGMIGTADIGARQMFESVQRFKQLPDYMMVWPAHGAGSACGKALGAVPMSTVGYEKAYNWAMQIDDEETFVKELLKDQPEAPVYFAEMKRINKIGPNVLDDTEVPIITGSDEFHNLLNKENVLVIDTRLPEIVQHDLVKGTINIPFNNGFTNWAGWLANYDEELVLIADQHREDIILALQSIGLDNIYAFVDTKAIEKAEKVTYDVIDLDEFIEVKDNEDVYVIDVRNLTEWNSGHFDQANHHFIGNFRRETLPELTDKTAIVYCVTGARSAIAASILKSMGYENVKHMTSSYQDALLRRKVSA